MNEFHDWWFSPTYLAQNIHFFQLQGNLNNAWHLSTIGTWGAILESILKTRFRTAETFLRTAMGRGSKIGMGRGKGSAMGKGKGAGNPEAKPHGEKRLRFVELLKGVLWKCNGGLLKLLSQWFSDSSCHFFYMFVGWCNCWCVHRSRGQLAATSGGCPSYSLCLPFAFSSFVSECRLCLSALSPWKFPSLFCCSIFWKLSFCSDCRCPSSIEELYIAWRIIPSSKWLGSPPFISHGTAIYN